MNSEDARALFEQRIAERLAKRKEAVAAHKKPEPSEEYQDLVPELEYELSDANQELDNVVESIDILDAYRRWCSKSAPKVYKNQRENIMVSCPVPSHPDKNPSAWINLDKQTWYCGSCSVGGDSHDIAAYHFGYPVPDYKRDRRFHELRKDMAQDYGYRLETHPGGVQVLVSPNDETGEQASAEQSSVRKLAPVPDSDSSQSSQPTQPAKQNTEEPESNVIELHQDEDEDQDEIIEFPALDWRSIVPGGTFLDVYMQSTTIDDNAEEYHFWNAMVAVGLACGRQVKLFDFAPIYGNIFLCTLGRTGDGKSRAKGYLDKLVDQALPYDHSDPSNLGVLLAGNVSSAEALVKNFQKDVSLDPSDPKSPTFLAPVKGLIDYNELSQLVNKGSRQGSVLKPTLMEFYDMTDRITSVSLASGKKEAKEPFASALTTSQPMALRELVNRADVDSGFLNRWLFIGGPQKRKFSIGGARVNIEPMILPLQRILGWASSFEDDEFMNWSNEAFQVFDEFFHGTIQPEKINSENSLLARIDLLMKKIILLLSANKQEKVVTRETVNEAIKIYPYIIQCYGVPSGQIGNTLQNEISEAIIHRVQRLKERHNRPPTANQISKSLRHRKYPQDLLLKVLETLVKLGYLEPEPVKHKGAGRPTVGYNYVG